MFFVFLFWHDAEKRRKYCINKQVQNKRERKNKRHSKNVSENHRVRCVFIRVPPCRFTNLIQFQIFNMLTVRFFSEAKTWIIYVQSFWLEIFVLSFVCCSLERCSHKLLCIIGFKLFVCLCAILENESQIYGQNSECASPKAMWKRKGKKNPFRNEYRMCRFKVLFNRTPRHKKKKEKKKNEDVGWWNVHKNNVSAAVL